MPTLLETQSAFRDAILLAAPERAATLCAGEDDAAHERLAIYRDTALGVLTGALRLTYPAVCRIVGVEFFDAAAELFIAQSPPGCGYLNVYGAGFGEFLAAFPPATSLCYLPEVAALEWAVNGALHAADAVPMPLFRLTDLGALGHEHVRLKSHPSLRLLTASFPAERLWRAVLDDDEAALSHFDFAVGPRWLLVSRTQSGVEIIAQPETEWHLTRALADGMPLDRALAKFTPENPARVLAAHFASGRFIDFSTMQATETPDV